MEFNNDTQRFVLSDEEMRILSPPAVDRTWGMDKAVELGDRIMLAQERVDSIDPSSTATLSERAQLQVRKIAQSRVLREMWPVLRDNAPQQLSDDDLARLLKEAS